MLIHPPYIQSFLDYLKFEKRYSAHTIISYETDLKYFFDFLEISYGQIPLTEISQAMVRSWLAQLKEEGIGAKTLNRKISTLRSFFKYLLRTDVLETTPMTNVISPKIPGRLPVFVKETETKAILENIAVITENWDTLNAKMLLTLFYTTGMRLSELINLKTGQVDSSRRQIKVLGKGNKERIIPVNKEIINMIAGYEQEKQKSFEDIGEFLLVTPKGRKMYPKYAYLLVKKYLASASTLEKKSPHVLRHTFATHLMNSGADLNAVKELLGHASLAATQVYTHNTIGKLKDIHKKAHPRP